jgi:hypothetical protein
MTKWKIALLASQWLLLCAPGHAQSYLNYLNRTPVYRPLTPEYVEWLRSKNFLPPPQFDRPYEGELKIVRGTQADLRAACPSSFKLGNHAIGCMQLHLQGMPCIIYILNDIGLQAIGWDYDIVLRHERGHCNGWKHD